MTTLAQYDRARAALAEATKVDQVLTIHDELEHIKLYARQIHDQALLADASEFQMRVERRLGVLLKAAKESGQIRQGQHGRKPEGESSCEEPSPFTLEEVGITKKLSSRAQQRAELPDEAFEASVTAMRERIAAGRARIIEADLPNGNRALMAGRQEPDDSLDFFPTPPWATRALMHNVLPHLKVTGSKRPSLKTKVWEPACGEGHISVVLRGYGAEVYASDVHDYGADQDGLIDFVGNDWPGKIKPGSFDWIITNPPFQGDKPILFVQRALEYAGVGVAMFFRSQWAVEGIERYEQIFRDTPPTLCAFFAERVNCCKGRWDPDGITATAYCWLVWIHNVKPQAPFWIPPRRREELTHPDDRQRFAAWSVAETAPEVKEAAE